MERIRDIDRRLIRWFGENGVHFLRVGLGVVFVWFGALKLAPGLSPAEGLIVETVGWIVDPAVFLPVLAVWECVIGLGLIVNRYPRLTLALLFAHMGGTFMPLVACPELVWTSFPFGWTLEGQYIVKNLVLVGAGLTLLGNVCRRRGVPDEGVIARDLARAGRLGDVWAFEGRPCRESARSAVAGYLATEDPRRRLSRSTESLLQAARR